MLEVRCPAETSGQNNIWASYEFCPENQHLWLMRYRSIPLGHDCSWLIINFVVRLLFCIVTNQTICPVQCNFIRQSQNVWKMANCWTLFLALLSCNHQATCCQWIETCFYFVARCYLMISTYNTTFYHLWGNFGISNMLPIPILPSEWWQFVAYSKVA